MKITTSTQKPKTQKPLIKNGGHLCRLFMIVDIGSVQSEYQGIVKKDKQGNPVMEEQFKMFWEVTDQSHVFDEQKGLQPFTHNITYKAKLSSGDTQYAPTKLYKDMSSLLGANLTKEECESFDVKKLLNKPAVLNFGSKVAKDTFTYNTLNSIAPCMEGQKPGPVKNPFIYFTMDPDSKCILGLEKKGKNSEGKDIIGFKEVSVKECFDALYPWLQKIVAASPEWQELSKNFGANTSPEMQEAEDLGDPQF